MYVVFIKAITAVGRSRNLMRYIYTYRCLDMIVDWRGSAYYIIKVDIYMCVLQLVACNNNQKNAALGWLTYLLGVESVIETCKDTERKRKKE